MDQNNLPNNNFQNNNLNNVQDGKQGNALFIVGIVLFVVTVILNIIVFSEMSHGLLEDEILIHLLGFSIQTGIASIVVSIIGAVKCGSVNYATLKRVILIIISVISFFMVAYGAVVFCISSFFMILCGSCGEMS